MNITKRVGLGRGLTSLIPKRRVTSILSAGENIVKIEISKISPNPRQPRKDFDEFLLLELANSIREHGVIQPLVATRGEGDRFELLAGERRLQAAKLAGLEVVPVVIRTATDQQKLEVGLVENLQRADLNPIEEAEALKQLVDDFNLSQEEAAKRVGKDRTVVANVLRLLTLPEEIQKALRKKKITFGHAKAVLSLKDEARQLALFNKILADGMTVRQVEEKVKRVKVKGYVRSMVKDPEIVDLEEQLQRKMATRVKINKKRKGGNIVIEYFSDEEFQGIIDKIL